ncbi:hypothetical protein DPEC_G00324390 [Dallia pectoralis]|uniref:Uncharacterized protein n=1 Tax=Dallia pectoralis TaxID=75939 RepID=A0ACC2FB01_DALPE|nr:hypothetical protein DPEC_G00324390 [Dallia pectoralis]
MRSTSNACADRSADAYGTRPTGWLVARTDNTDPVPPTTFPRLEKCAGFGAVNTLFHWGQRFCGCQVMFSKSMLKEETRHIDMRSHTLTEPFEMLV